MQETEEIQVQTLGWEDLLKIAQIFMVSLLFQEMYPFSYEVKQSLSLYVPFLFELVSIFMGINS